MCVCSCKKQLILKECQEVLPVLETWHDTKNIVFQITYLLMIYLIANYLQKCECSPVICRKYDKKYFYQNDMIMT